MIFVQFTSSVMCIGHIPMKCSLGSILHFTLRPSAADATSQSSVERASCDLELHITKTSHDTLPAPDWLGWPSIHWATPAGAHFMPSTLYQGC